jgi:CRP-like cAMP-binding protein
VMTIGKGAVLRARGTLDTAVALDLACASESCVAATWAEDAVEAALGACPWVEDDLRASADRVQAQAGATLGTLGQKLSPELRANIVNRLTMRAFAESEVIVTEGVPVPGILLVGAGKVELVLNGVATGEVTPGQFILASEAMSAGPSPASVRAAAGGALLFMADRKLSQELFATEPLLLELFAGW